MSQRKIKKYLPSKKFQIILIILVILIIIIFLIFYLFSNKTKYQNENSLVVKEVSLLELMEKDTDNDGVPDWEERLWGTDINNKTTFGIPDAVYIQNKKKELSSEEEVNQKELNETDLFAKDYFSAFMALYQTEGVSNETINEFSKKIGQEIMKKEIKNEYFKKDVLISEIDNLNSKENYYKKLSSIFDKYIEKGVGEEELILAGALTKYEEDKIEIKIYELVLIGEAYQDFAEEIMNIQVPRSLVDYHIDIANASNNAGIAIYNLSQSISNPIVSMPYVPLYEENREKLIKTVDLLKMVIEEKLE